MSGLHFSLCRARFSLANKRHRHLSRCLLVGISVRDALGYSTVLSVFCCPILTELALVNPPALDLIGSLGENFPFVDPPATCLNVSARGGSGSHRFLLALFG